MNQHQATAAPAKTRRLATFSALVGVPLLLAGLFLPLITRINYLAHAGCPDSPQCPPPSTDTNSYWAISALVGLAPLLTVIFAQALIARSAWRGSPSRALLRWGLLAGSVALLVFLFLSFFWYCFFFCNLEQGLPIPGQLYSATGMWVSPGVRYLEPGFWLLLSGLLLILATDLTLLVNARRSNRQPA